MELMKNLDRLKLFKVPFIGSSMKIVVNGIEKIEGDSYVYLSGMRL